ncbi:hypothetical protein H4582DRAFT_2067010 [Lactarius indigo]|nr:hypothetical protein H4582DRAFT_2067010 [Lactarius indigo]
MNGNCPVSGYPLQLTPGENHFADFSASYQTVEQWTGTGDLVYILLQPNFLPPSSFLHRQERDRRELKHVPYFIHCPLPHCMWRGNRTNLFKKHWQQEDHRSSHEYYGHTPGRSQIETFDPWLILNQIIDGVISLREGEGQAISWFK